MNQNSIDNIPVGKCGKCGGIMSEPKVWFSTTRPPKRCESCGAHVDEAGLLPPGRWTLSMTYVDQYGSESDHSEPLLVEVDGGGDAAAVMPMK